MTSVADIVRRFSVKLMLVAIVALALQMGGVSAHGLGDTDDCSNDVHVSQSVGRVSATVERGGVGHLDKAPCKSTCCHAACSLALLAASAPVEGPATESASNASSVVRGADGIDIKGLSRPPRIPLAV